MKVQPGIAIIVLVIIVIVAMFCCLMIPPGTFDKSRTKTFITVFAGLSLVLTVMFYYILIRLQVVQSELLELRETQEMQDAVLAVNKQITCASKVIPWFCAELLPLQIIDAGTEASSRRRNIEEISNENELSELIFNVFQVAVLEYKFVKEQEVFYTRLFLQWTTSKTLKKNWEAGRISLIPKVQQFGDLLFQFAPKKNKHDPCSYVKACEDVKATKEYKSIFC
jgi:hypothetical protein